MSFACLAVGSRVTDDGGVWTVIELEGDCVTVEEQDSGRTRSVRISQLLSTPGSCLLDPPAEGPVGAVGPLLANLTELELSAVNERAGHVREVLTGYRSGSAEEALAGEPRACYRPGAGLMERYRAKAEELAVGLTTVRRWVQAFQQDGEAGLVDARHQRVERPVERDRCSLAG